jgi:ATP-dependent RNA helicase RhlE
MTRFDDLGLSEPLLRALRDEHYDYPTPIQQQTIPHVLAGRDLLGCAQTGTGKTAAFALPILQRLQVRPAHRHVRALILTPTRELAAQIGDSFRRYGRYAGLNYTTIYGGVSQDPQVRAIRGGVDIVIATPGRLIDLMQQRHAALDTVEVLVLDEADRMLDMGFIHDVRRIVGALPKRRQTLFFSATMPLDIQNLASDILKEPFRVEVAPAATPVQKISQSLYHVERGGKFELLSGLLKDPALRRMIVFTRTKRAANKLAQMLNKGVAKADAIHGNKGQGARERALDGFRRGSTRVLVATDIASRGIDIDDITHVINYDLPDVPENYVHRIGRTARAGAEGVAIAFCSPEEREELAAVERLIRMRIPVRSTPGHGVMRRPDHGGFAGETRARGQEAAQGRNQGGAQAAPQGRPAGPGQLGSVRPWGGPSRGRRGRGRHQGEGSRAGGQRHGQAGRG